MDEQRRRQLARDLLRTAPEDVQERLMYAAREATEMACEETGAEVTPELVAAVALDAVEEGIGDICARIGEITDEEIRRIIDEERARHTTDRGVDLEALVKSVRSRALEEHGHLLFPRRSRPAKEDE